MIHLSKEKQILIICFSLLLILFFSNVQAVKISPIKQGKTARLVQVCDNCTFVNITTIQYPDSTLLSVNKAMTKNGANYNYSFTGTGSIGDYSYTTCGNPDGVFTCETANFLVSASGFDGMLGLSIVIMFLTYAIAFIGFFGKNEWVTILGGLAMITLGLFTLNNGIDIFRNTMTEAISFTTIGLGAFFSIFTAIEVVNSNL